MGSHTADIIIVTLAVLIPSLAGLAGYWLRLRSSGSARDEAAAEVLELRADMETLRADQQRQVDELNERLDFAERLLAQHRDPPRLERGGSVP